MAAGRLQRSRGFVRSNRPHRRIATVRVYIYVDADLPQIPTDTTRRPLLGALVVALAGIGLAWVHWLGLFVAGALVGLASRTLPRAVLAGLLVGGIVLVVQILSIPGVDAGQFIALRPPVYVTVAAAFGALVWGSLVRGVV